MKRIFTFLVVLFLCSLKKTFSQADSCVVLGCAANYGTQTTNNSLPFLAGGFPGSCYSAATYKQIFWQFFYFDPTDLSGLTGPPYNFEQTYTPTNGTIPLDIDWNAYDMGTTAPSVLKCPIDPSAWTEVRCSGAGTFGDPAGPGINGDLQTVPGHYYAIGIIVNPGGADPTPDANFTFTVGTPTLGGAPLTSANCIPIILPVKLTSFNARVNNCIVDLDWTAETEADFKSYEVQYSTDGSTYKTIATNAANGANQKYSFRHNSAAQGNIYYRLKMINIDGTVGFSKIIAMKLNCSKSETVVYPNPVKDLLNVNITNGQDNITTARLYDNNGRLIYSGRLISGTNSINMTGFAKGIYILTLKNNNGVQNIKVVK